MTDAEYQQWLQGQIASTMRPGFQMREGQQLTLNDLFGVQPADDNFNLRTFASGENPNAWWFDNRPPNAQSSRGPTDHRGKIAQAMRSSMYAENATRVPTAQPVENTRRPVAIVERRTPKTLSPRDHDGVRHAWNPDQYIRSFRLVDDDGKTLSVIDDGGYRQPGRGHQEAIRGFSGQTFGPMRRGHYRNLMEGLIRHGLNVRSNDRNSMSHPFHTKLQRTLPPDMTVEARMFRGDGDVEHYDEGEYDPSDVSTDDVLLYERIIPSSPENWGDLSGPTRSQFPLFVQHRERPPYHEHPESEKSQQTQLFAPRRPIGVSPSTWAATNRTERRKQAERDLRERMDRWFSRQQQGEQALRQGGVSLDETLDLGLLPGISQPPMPRMEYETNPRFVGVKSTPDVM
tara:strand:- start:12169 stop:13371 length:1203 start_codon:yes stop_codon:yes gene_type:complete